jgi:hypothetical protein
MSLRRDPTWTEADAGTFGDGRVAPPDLAELDAQQRSTYDPTPAPFGLYHRKIFAHRARPNRVIPDPVTAKRATCHGCGHGLRWIKATTYTRRSGKAAGTSVAVPGYWSH